MPRSSFPSGQFANGDAARSPANVPSPSPSQDSQSQYSKSQQALDRYYQEIYDTILSRQHPISGLLPASTAVTAHGDYTDAWVRDNVYSILAVWGLALAYRRAGSPPGRLHLLENSVVKLMRGLLFSMMRQAQKVEKFKYSQSPLDALHAKYSTTTGLEVVGDDEWGHLQLDATSLFVLTLAQMTSSGLGIIYSIDEVNFVQNLVYYIGRTYRTPDFGLWERGNKINHGNAELNASSIGMAKAALEAIRGLDLFGAGGSQASVIHVLSDEIARSRITLASLLPRESASKETDAALLSVIGFPAFAIEDPDLVQRTRDKIVAQLGGRYGCKRFLRDGHQTAIEDHTRLHYEPSELQAFEHIECEWPLFFTYLYLDALFRGDDESIEQYRNALAAVTVERQGYRLLPELYYVPKALIEAEKQNPQSQTRLPNENLPLVWAQSLYLLGQMLDDGLLAPGDLDPQGRHLQICKQRQPTIQIALIAENDHLQGQLAEYGIASQTLEQIAPTQVRSSIELGKIYNHIGANFKLELSGRPIRRLRSLMTSQVFKIQGQQIVFLPSFLDQQQFYITLDYHFLVSQIRAEIAYISRHWSQLGRATMTLLLTKELLQEGQAEFQNQEYNSPLLALLHELQGGRCQGVAIRLGPLSQLVLTAGTEQIDSLPGFKFDDRPTDAIITAPSKYLRSTNSGDTPLTTNQEFRLESATDLRWLLDTLRQTDNIYQQVELLHRLVKIKSLNFDTGWGGIGRPVTLAQLLTEVYYRAGQAQPHPNWAVVRYSAGVLGKVDMSLSDSVTEILVRGKQIAVGMAYSEDSLIDAPIAHSELVEKIDTFCREDIRDRVLTQEILIYLSLLIKAEPRSLDGMLTLRVGYLILLITSEIATEQHLTQDEAYEALMSLSPFEIKIRLRHVAIDYHKVDSSARTKGERLVFQQESLHLSQNQDIQWELQSEAAPMPTPTGGWLRQRRRDGAVNRLAVNFYPSIWQLLEHCPGIIVGDKLEKRNRLESAPILAEMTPGERNFALRVEHLLNKITAPEYRQLNIEALMALAALSEQNPDLRIAEYVVLDVLIGHAVRLAWLDPDLPKPLASGNLDLREAVYAQYKAQAWSNFYETSPQICASYIVKSLQFLGQLAIG
jgi:phosphorylase kinase alpha/beta subunit